jgi:hypothetical protein
VCHNCGLAVCIKKYLKANEELRKLKYFTMKKYILQKNPLKENQNPSRYSSISLHFLYKHVTTIIFYSASFYKSLIRHVGGLKIGSGHNSIILQESIGHVGGLKIGSGHN